MTQRDRPAIEWIFGAISAAAVACLMLFLFYRALVPDGERERLTVTVERIEPLANGVAVQIRLVNAGGDPIAGASVLAIAADGSFETREIGFDFVAARSVRRGVFLLPAGVDGGAASFEVGGYVVP